MKDSPLLIALCTFFLFNTLLLWAFPVGPVSKCQPPNAGGTGYHLATVSTAYFRDNAEAEIYNTICSIHNLSKDDHE